MPKIGVRIDGTFVLVLVGLAGAAYLYVQREKLIKAINPADPDNVVNTAVTAAVGEETIATAADYIFGGLDLLNPFASAERKRYAKLVYGLENDPLE